jgi:hypothetical protein
VLQKVADGKDVLKITVKASGLGRGGGGSQQLEAKSELCSAKHIEPTGPTMVSRPKMLKPKNPEVDE